MTDAPQTTMPLTKLQKRFLARRSCGWCGNPLDLDNCGAIFWQCSVETRTERRAKLLATYKPKKVVT